MKIYSIIILATLAACSSHDDRLQVSEDNNNYLKVETDTQQNTADTKSTLSEIEETYDNLNYNSVINSQSLLIPDGMSNTKFRYFVIFSDLDEDLTYKLIDNDIRNTIDAMKNNYVNKLPVNVTPVYLFKDFNTYKNFVLKNYDIPESDISPYGFFKISKNVIVIRYVSWKGSIKHELTHKFLKADFPDAPSWFEEGLAAMNEKSTFSNGNLIADYSMRMLAIQRALKDNSYTGLEYLMKTNDDELYSKRASFYYAQSRYLLMYLQQMGILEKYYKEFRDTIHEDNTGITQLESITGKPISELEDTYVDFIKNLQK
ncbi:MAG: hypothetical protein IT280_10545 [Ignavibacteria bacterium]|nr:hypothetical protein [Ignavibacteria bacterium]